VQGGAVVSRKRRLARAPLVSVCVPSFNHARFLPAAIESVLAQTYPRIELVIVDDGSADGSLEIAQNYALRYPERVKVFVHDGHARRGISATANLAFEKSSGDYWCGLSSDDAFVADKVERQVSFLEQHPDIGMVYGRGTVIDDCGRVLGPGFVIDLSRERDPLPRLLQENCIWGQTAMIRRECFDKVGLHDGHLMYSDWELWIRIAAHYKIAFLAGVMTYYRIHPGNSSIGLPPEVQLERHLEVMKTLEQKAPGAGGGLARPFIRALIELQLAYLYFCARDQGAADRAIKAAVEIDPAILGNIRFLTRWLRHRQGQTASFTSVPPHDFLVWFTRQAVPLAAVGKDKARPPFSRWRLQFALLLAEYGFGAGQLRRRAWRRVAPLLWRRVS
jgi:glycosyltransferase involved in cell wall biosynthesis